MREMGLFLQYGTVREGSSLPLSPALALRSVVEQSIISLQELRRRRRVIRGVCKVDATFTVPLPRSLP